jgi:choline kinase
MKVQTDASGWLSRITKLMEPTSAVGEYIGVTLVGPNFGAALSDALEATFTRDPNLYYEDAYQELVNRGHQVALTPIGTVDWIEVDNLEDLERAKDIACRS